MFSGKKEICTGTSKTSAYTGSIENFEYYGAKGCSINNKMERPTWHSPL
jgi:hypothetical protein